MKIVIMGASGLLGTKLMKGLSNSHEVIGTCFKKKIEGLFEIDATSYKQVRSFLIEKSPNLVIDTIGIPNIQICDKNPELAKKINFITADNIARVCKEINTKMIFISSSQVYGRGNGNYSEDDETKGDSTYARTKLLAEESVLKMEDSIVLRPEFIFGYNGKEYKNDLIDIILNSKEFEVRNPSQMRQPIVLEDLLKIIENLIDLKFSGILNAGGKDRLTKIEFIKKLSKRLNKEMKISIHENFNDNFFDSTLNLSKLENIGITTSTIEESISIILKQLNKN